MSTVSISHAPHLSTLYSQHHGWLYGWLRGKLGNAGDAADLAQDTFVRLMGKREAAPLREPRGYLATIARGLLIDRYRRQALEQAYLEALARQPEPHTISAETQAIIIETLLAVDRLLERLGTRTRAVFLLAQIEELSYVEISARLGVSLPTVKKHLVRAYTECLVLAAT
ncbi:sigma-70 family RNA polymerase sigma factor [Janthinobacterium psychrotolerans]|uniref:RNA polymerase sigma-70 factor, ECF subfamily n=1 Tax=Janthinobacterium psychrotolerans TaxID=1747903 RepID=A0A1A7C0U3_9BURK|nr:sigma-70 family RNA polymerase sigma factor [Janthinobacterium psychrotolerans]OBV38350.1 RNA polymerase sigma-70 factor, ECF subfamily [Janthinobacterium psychrotolerans]